LKDDKMEWIETISDDDDYDDIFDPSKEPIKIFACRHSFHIRCLKKHYKHK